MSFHQLQSEGHDKMSLVLREKVSAALSFTDMRQTEFWLPYLLLT